MATDQYNPELVDGRGRGRKQFAQRSLTKGVVPQVRPRTVPARLGHVLGLMRHQDQLVMRHGKEGDDGVRRSDKGQVLIFFRRGDGTFGRSCACEGHCPSVEPVNLLSGGSVKGGPLLNCTGKVRPEEPPLVRQA